MLKSRTNFKHFLQTKLANVKVLTKSKHFWPLLTFVDWNTMFRGGSKWKLDPLGPHPAFRFLTKTNCWNHKNKEIYRVNLTAKSSYFLRKKKFVDYFFSNIFFSWGLRDSVVACGTPFVSPKHQYTIFKSRARSAEQNFKSQKRIAEITKTGNFGRIKHWKYAKIGHNWFLEVFLYFFARKSWVCLNLFCLNFHKLMAKYKFCSILTQGQSHHTSEPKR